MPVVMLTGWGQRLVADGAVPAHVDHMLGKPPKLQTLKAALALVTQRGGPDAGSHALPEQAP